jgi:hypothetical protein
MRVKISDLIKGGWCRNPNYKIGSDGWGKHGWTFYADSRIYKGERADWCTFQEAAKLYKNGMRIER